MNPYEQGGMFEMFAFVNYMNQIYNVGEEVFILFNVNLVECFL